MDQEGHIANNDYHLLRMLKIVKLGEVWQGNKNGLAEYCNYGKILRRIA